MTPAGHASISYLSSKLSKKLIVVWVVIGGIIPDIDFLFLPFDFFNSIHRVVTHNIFFAIFTSLIVSIFYKNGTKKKMVFVSLLIGILLHIAVDSVMDNNPSNGMGVALFWPLSKDMFQPFNVLPIKNVKTGWHNPADMIQGIIPEIFFELPFTFTAIIIASKNKKLGSQKKL